MNAFIFPAFINELTGSELEFLLENDIDFNSYLLKASQIANQEYTDCTYQENCNENNCQSIRVQSEPRFDCFLRIFALYKNKVL